MKSSADILTMHATGEMWVGKYTGGRLYPTHDEIAERAYGLYVSRGRQDGRAVEDWLRAERELEHHYA
jgi:Protein of unknown function (DUF2934)